MPNTLTKIEIKNIKRIRQLTDNHCGPAVLVMLASFWNTKLDQREIVEAAEALNSYKKNGMTVKQLSLAVKKLSKNLILRYKIKSSLHDLDYLINKIKIPVGVEWQGKFGQFADEDNGHYSMAVKISLNQGYIILSDPFSAFAGKDRKIKISEFLQRWWDVNNSKKDVRTLFIVVKKHLHLKKELKMSQFRHLIR